MMRLPNRKEDLAHGQCNPMANLMHCDTVKRDKESNPHSNIECPELYRLEEFVEIEWLSPHESRGRAKGEIWV